MESLPRSRAIARTSASDSQGAKNPNDIEANAVTRGPLARPGVRSAPGASGGRKALQGKGLRGSLGTTAKFAAVVEQTEGLFDPETGEISALDTAPDPAGNRVLRFVLQSVVKGLMGSSRTAKCLRWRQVGKQVEVWNSIEYRKATYKGLQTCGSVWACPVCAAKVAERRRAEILAAMTAHKAAGGAVFLLTLTAPHQRRDGILDLLEKHATALRSFWSRRSVKDVLAEMGIIGHIRAAEVTHGRKSEHNNGWHPHHHILAFAGVGVDSDAFTVMNVRDWSVRLYLQWAKCCEAAGLGCPSFDHGLKLDDGSKAAAYVSKWGLEDEMTKGHTKKASKGETPFDFLRAILADASDKEAGRLFVEFAGAFKGKQQLRWSRGLKKRFAIGELSDEELAAQSDDLAYLLGSLTLIQWRAVLRVEGRGELLQVAESGGWPAVLLYLEGIGLKP